MVESAPKIAAVAGLQAAGVPAPVSAGLVFGTTEEGFDPKQALIAAALPVIGKYTGSLTEAIAAKAGVSSQAALQALNKMGGAAGAASLVGADQLREIMKLPPEKRKEALIEAAANVGSTFVLEALSGGKKPEKLQAPKIQPEPRPTPRAFSPTQEIPSEQPASPGDAQRSGTEEQSTEKKGPIKRGEVTTYEDFDAPEGPVHHVATDKNWVSTACGGPWSPRLDALFKKAGMTLQDGLNKISLPEHYGPHPEAYHQAVFNRLKSATEGLSGEAYAKAFKAALTKLANEAKTSGTELNKLLTE